MNHELIETKVGWLIGLVLVAVSFGGMVELFPLVFEAGKTQPIENLRPYTALELEGRDIYIREGCNNCHSQQVRPLKSETDRYGHYSLASEGAYDRPFLWGSRRTGPDLHRVGGRYPDSWHWVHFEDPRRLEPRSNMPAFTFLTTTPLDMSLTQARLEALRTLGHPYSDDEVEHAERDALAQASEIAGRLRSEGIELDEIGARSEAIALIAYLQSLGRAVAASVEGS